MGIPNEIYRFISHARFPNHGALIVVDEVEYSLRCDRLDDGYNWGVVGTMTVYPDTAEQLAQLKAEGWDTYKGPHIVKNKGMMAWRRVPLSQIPYREAAEWETWDKH